MNTDEKQTKAPAFQFYADRFVAGTTKFSDAEVGLYIRLLCAQWSEGRLPNDDDELASYGRGDTRIDRVKLKFDECSDGYLRNKMLESVRAEQIKHRKERAQSGKLGARVRWHSHSIANSKLKAPPLK